MMKLNTFASVSFNFHISTFLTEVMTVASERKHQHTENVSPKSASLDDGPLEFVAAHPEEHGNHISPLLAYQRGTLGSDGRGVSLLRI